MSTLLSPGSSLLEKMEVFNCLTTFQFTHLTELKQWSLLHPNQPVVPRAIPVPGFEQLMFLPEVVDQGVPASTKGGLESTHKKAFLEDLDEVDALFNGSTDESMFNFNPEKDLDQVSDEFLDEVLCEPSLCGPSSGLIFTADKAKSQTVYNLFNSESSHPIERQSNILVGDYVISPSQPNSSFVSVPNNSIHSHANSLNDSNPKSLVDSHPNSLIQCHSNSPGEVIFINPVQSKSNSQIYSLPNSPICSHCTSPIHSPPQSPEISESGLINCSTDDGIESQSGTSDLEGADDYLDLSMDSAVLSSPIPDEACDQLLHVKNEPELPPMKSRRRKRGPRPQVKYRGDGPMQLWQFLLELLIGPEYTNLVRWTQDEDYEFKILKPSTVAKMWGEKKNKPTMNYEKLSRGLRYYYGKSVIEKVHGKRYVYQFKCDIPKILGYDPMAPVKSEEDAEDLVHGEPVMSPEQVEDLLVNSSAEDGLLALI